MRVTAYSDLDPGPNQTATDYGATFTARGHLRWADLTAITAFATIV